MKSILAQEFGARVWSQDLWLVVVCCELPSPKLGLTRTTFSGSRAAIHLTSGEVSANPKFWMSIVGNYAQGVLNRIRNEKTP